MDIWSPEPERHKRSFTEMSHPATLSPSPISFGDPPASNFFSSRFPSAPANDNFASFFDRRRTSHPHNHPLQRASEEMSERSQSQQRPRLEHRASQTIIDLTDEPEELPVPSRNNEDRSRSQRPPQLGRSDAVSLGDFIDLTDDNGEPDIIIMGGRQLPPPRPSAARPLPRPLRADSPSLFVPVPPQPINRVFPAHRHGVVIGVSGRVERNGRVAEAQYHMAARMGQEIMDHIQAFHDVEQAMPGFMNYQHHAFVDRKPQHVAPPPAKEGFTRSPEESQTIICPSCEEELIHKKDEEQPVAKKGGKAPSKKDREEHPFWVLKECGHVYCNSCFQYRSQSGKYGSVSFRESSKPSANSKSKSAKILCAVDDCESDVKSKDKWVGVFL